jgi:putative transposase
VGLRRAFWVAWAFTEAGERVLLSVMLGMRESDEDWLALGRDLIVRELGAPLLVVADGAPGLITAIEQCWPASDRQHCRVHRVRNLLAKLPERERVRAAYWQALDDAVGERDGKQRLGALSASSTAPATPPPPSAWPTIWTRSSCTCATRPDTAAGGDRRTCSNGRWPRSTPHQGDRPLPRQDQCLTFVWAVLDLDITHANNGVRFSQLERQRLRPIRYAGSDVTTDEEVNAA